MTGAPGALASDNPRLTALRCYLAALALGSLAWEFLHMPLYTLWWTGTWSEIMFSALHCTGGDLLIGLATLTTALLIAGNPAWPRERFRRVAVLTVCGGLLYTGFSEWLNVEVRRAWAYSDLMPVVRIAGFGLGLSPLLQWLVVPTVALRIASSAMGSRPDTRRPAGEAPRGTIDVAQLPSERTW